MIARILPLLAVLLMTTYAPSVRAAQLQADHQAVTQCDCDCCDQCDCVEGCDCCQGGDCSCEDCDCCDDGCCPDGDSVKK